MRIPETTRAAKGDGREVRDVPGYPGYKIDSQGILYGLNGNRRRLTPDNRGYVRAVLKDRRGKLRTRYLHKLVWDTFGPHPIPKGWEIHHVDDDPTNNATGNLAIASHKFNICISGQYGRRFDIAALSRRRAKPVERIDPDDNSVEWFPSLRAAAAALAKPGIGSATGRTANLSKAIKKGIKAYGYLWQYV